MFHFQHSATLLEQNETSLFKYLENKLSMTLFGKTNDINLAYLCPEWKVWCKYGKQKQIKIYFGPWKGFRVMTKMVASFPMTHPPIWTSTVWENIDQYFKLCKTRSELITYLFAIGYQNPITYYLKSYLSKVLANNKKCIWFEQSPGNITRQHLNHYSLYQRDWIRKWIV